jgi:hypothetical protein
MKLDQPQKALAAYGKAGGGGAGGDVFLNLAQARIHDQLNDDQSAAFYKKVLQTDASNVEAIASLASNHFYTDQVRLSERLPLAEGAEGNLVCWEYSAGSTPGDASRSTRDGRRCTPPARLGSHRPLLPQHALLLRHQRTLVASCGSSCGSTGNTSDHFLSAPPLSRRSRCVSTAGSFRWVATPRSCGTTSGCAASTRLRCGAHGSVSLGAHAWAGRRYLLPPPSPPHTPNTHNLTHTSLTHTNRATCPPSMT